MSKYLVVLGLQKKKKKMVNDLNQEINGQL